MKEFLKNKKITYNLMSFTGFKSLVLFSLLIDSPKSYEEICDYLLNHPYIRESISLDTVRVYINSLKRIGCEVKRVRVGKVSKYVILSNPFEFDLNEEQISTLTKIYKTLTKNIDVQELLILEKFISKLTTCISNVETKSKMSKITIFKDVTIELVEQLTKCCDEKKYIVINYNSPHSQAKNIEILTDKVEYTDNKFYLYGTGFEYNQYSSFLISRITEIKEIKSDNSVINPIKNITVGYELKCNPQTIVLDDNDKIINYEGNVSLIETTTSNEFLLCQKLLSYGSDCKVLYPESFKQNFISHLKAIREGYGIV